MTAARAEALLTVAEVARLWRVSKNFVYDRISSGALRSVNLSGSRAKTRVCYSKEEPLMSESATGNLALAGIPAACPNCDASVASASRTAGRPSVDAVSAPSRTVLQPCI